MRTYSPSKQVKNKLNSRTSDVLGSEKRICKENTLVMRRYRR